MALTEDQAVEQARQLMDLRATEMDRLDRIRDYLRDDPDRRLQGLPSGLPTEVYNLARVSRVNMLKFVVNSRVQNMFVEGFRTPRAADDVPAWNAWRRNRMGKRQIGIHRGALAYGASYATVLPGDSVPVIRGASPRQMTAAYGDDDDWPRYALEKGADGAWRLYDDEAVYIIEGEDADRWRVTGIEVHGATLDGEPVCPVVRYRETDDLDDPVMGIVWPLRSLQDQINITTFGLQVAQHYGAFRQRYVLGWLAESEEQKLRASASKLWTFDDHPDDIEVGEFEQTNLTGYIDSREATLRHLATISQTPARQLLGQLVNLSAEALAAAEASHRRAVGENQTCLGEGHDQTMSLVGEMMGERVDPVASVRWRDTEARSLGMVVDALGKLSQMLGVPPQELWDRVPGVSQDEVERWRVAAAEGDALANLTSMLERQAAPAEPAGAGVGADA